MSVGYWLSEWYLRLTTTSALSDRVKQISRHSGRSSTKEVVGARASSRSTTHNNSLATSTITSKKTTPSAFSYHQLSNDDKDEHELNGKGEREQKEEKEEEILAYIPQCCAAEHNHQQQHHTHERADNDGDDEDIIVLRNIPYISESDSMTTIRHQLDIYSSPSAMRAYLDAHPGESRVPVIVHVHGGGWQRGHRDDHWTGGPGAGRCIARHGMIAVLPSYRLASPPVRHVIVVGVLIALLATGLSFAVPIPIVGTAAASFFLRWSVLSVCMSLITIFRQHRSRHTHSVSHPGAALDVCRSILWTRERLEAHIPLADINRLFLSGHSAGGHLVSLIATDRSYLSEVGINDITFLKGVIPISGIYSMLTAVNENPRNWRNRIFFHFYCHALFSHHHHVNKKNNISMNDAAREASPLYHLEKYGRKRNDDNGDGSETDEKYNQRLASLNLPTLPPFLIFSAEFDYGLQSTAHQFVSKLDQLELEYEYWFVPHTTHPSVTCNWERLEAHRIMMRWINRQLQK